MRRKYRPPAGIPERKQERWQGWVASLLAHLLFLALILLPVLRSDWDLKHVEGAGGAGPAGGGGGSGGGASGAQNDRLQFVALTAPTRVAQPAVQSPPSVVQPLAPRPLSPPVIAPPTPSTPQPPTQTHNQASATSPSHGDSTATGTGAAGIGGAGSGSAGVGGGIGSGEGTGRGSGVGGGTGGGNAQIYPPTPRQLFLPPLPAPRALRGFRLIAWFDVDSTGKANLLRFTPSPDNDYNKRLRETLLGMRFRPAVRPDGVPVRDTTDVQFLF